MATDAPTCRGIRGFLSDAKAFLILSEKIREIRGKLLTTPFLIEVSP